MVPVFLCIFAGRYIDSRFGTNWTFVLMILGFLAGVSSAWRLAARVAAMERKELEQRKKSSWNDGRRSMVRMTGRDVRKNKAGS